MIGLRAQIDSPPVVRALQETPGALAELTDAAVGRVAEALQGSLQEAAPVGKTVPGGREPGTLRRSIRFSQDGAVAEFFAVGYAELVIGGTSAHTITPNAASALSFFWQRVGTWVVFTSVNHPGTRANDFRAPAIAATEAAVDAELVQIGDQIFQRL